ncbi:DUF6186 family protein [Leifsonia sp. AG29]|uniref:DUF6186 family protein n=1 Tax=Leifsonia sp. AG29 TaxID=2598860 RepID=UPI00131B91FD|nr:DUF6186 family protein [Leifsonia sp. AG29]
MRDITVAGFIVCGLLIAGLVAEAHRRHAVLVPVSTLLDRIMTDRAARMTVLLFWWWIGFHFLVVPPQP